MTAINPQAIRGPVTAVPVVAGKGVRLVADTENNRVVAEADETVLFEDASGALDSVTLNETLSHFERVDIVWTDWSSSSCTRVSRYMANSENFMLDGTWAGSSTSILIWSIAMTPNAGKTALSKTFARHITLTAPSTVNQANNVRIIKVVGINRVSASA